MNDAEPKCARCFCIPQRFIIGIMTSFAIVNCYTLRVSLSIAITEMMPFKVTNDSTDEKPCASEVVIKNNTVHDPSILYDWSATERGLIMSAFYWGYCITHIPGGLLAEKKGAKHVLGLGILITGIFTIITPPILLAVDGDPIVFIVVRVLEGLGEGQAYPAASVILGQWIPAAERGTWCSMVYAGSQFGTIISNLASGFLIQYFEHWSIVFYFFGLLSIIWWIAWQLFCYSTPEIHPCITNKEKLYLRECAAADNIMYGEKPTPWGPILRSMPVWSLVISQCGHDWGWYTLISDLPKYMKHILGFDILENGLYSALPYFIMWLISVGSGLLCDFLVNRGSLSVTFARKMFNTIGAVGPAVFLMGASYSGCNRMLGVIMFTLALGTMGTFYCGLKVNALDLSPNYAGTLMAIVNGSGSLMGIVTPYLTSAMTAQNTVWQWRWVFIISFITLVSTNFAFIFFGSGKQQWWNDVPTVVEYYRKKSEAKEAKKAAKAAEKAERARQKEAKNAASSSK